MDATLTVVPPAHARARLAELIIGEGLSSAGMGSITLKPHQQSAVTRIEAAMREFGGALLADETGLGKTFVALRVARTASRPLIVAPAGLREMWCQAGAAAEVGIDFASIESLSRRRASRTVPHDLVIIDEAHHLRNPATARYRAVAGLTENTRVLLLSATPVHNAASDLAALLALFLGARAFTLDPAWVSRCIIRRASGDTPSVVLPRVTAPRSLRVPHDDGELDAILALPPPVPPIDGGDGGALLVYSLLRQWASTQGALVEALRRRLTRAMAILSGLDVGRYPSRSELHAWSFADGVVQLAFPELMIADDGQGMIERDLAACVARHADAVRALLSDLEQRPDADLERAAQLRAVRSQHAGVKVVVFSQYAASVSAIFRLMRTDPGVAALSADGGRVAGGALTRAETLARFAPRAQGAAALGRAYRIDCLLTTDLLSEGVNLQDAGVVVHLDLPWTPARMAQRVGRVARIGSAHDEVVVYAMLPPASSEKIVRVEQRLRDKLRESARTVGVAGTILPSLALSDEGQMPPVIPSVLPAPSDTSPARSSEAILTLIAGWRAQEASRPSGCEGDTEAVTSAPPSRESPTAANPIEITPDRAPVVASVHAPLSGFLAVVADAAQPRLIADIGQGPTEDHATVLAALHAAGGAESYVDPRAQSRALAAIAHWRSGQRMHHDLSLDGALRARARRSVVDRIAAITRRAPRHLRPTITALAATARQTAITHYGAGAERVLGELAVAAMPDEAWLRAVSSFGAVHGAVPLGDREPDRSVIVLILLSAADPRVP